MTGTATFIKQLNGISQGRVYRLDPPLISEQDYRSNPVEFVWVSAVTVPFSGPETYIFASDENGAVSTWLELEGSYKGSLDHAEALAGAGYEGDGMTNDVIHINPGNLSAALDLRNRTPLAHCTRLDSNESGGIYVERNWPSLSSGEELVWSVLGWLNGQDERPSMDDLRGGLDGATYAAVAAVLWEQAGVKA